MSENNEKERRLWLEAEEKNRKEWNREWNDWIKNREKTIAQEAKEGKAYTTLIIGAGYASFFGLWHLVSPKLNDIAMSISCLFILASGIIFVSFEIYKIGKQSFMYYCISEITNSNLSAQEKSRKYDAAYAKGSIPMEAWITHFAACTILSMFGVMILAWNLIMVLIENF